MRLHMKQVIEHDLSSPNWHLRYHDSYASSWMNTFRGRSKKQKCQPTRSAVLHCRHGRQDFPLRMLVIRNVCTRKLIWSTLQNSTRSTSSSKYIAKRQKCHLEVCVLGHSRANLFITMHAHTNRFFGPLTDPHTAVTICSLRDKKVSKWKVQLAYSSLPHKFVACIAKLERSNINGV